MAIEALSSSELLNFIIYDTLSANPFSCCNDNSPETGALFFDNGLTKPPHEQPKNGGLFESSSCSMMPMQRIISSSCRLEVPQQISSQKQKSLGVAQVRKKRRRRPKVCKNKEEAETQRMTHIAVERNRRKQMNEHLGVLRSLMPSSYVQRGDQASIVGGAIEYVKELEHMLQSLEAQKFLLQQVAGQNDNTTKTTATTTTTTAGEGAATPFTQFFNYPQFTCSQFPTQLCSKSKQVDAIADIEVTLVETHANVRILCRRRVRQLSKMVAAFQTLYLTILHLSVTTLDPLVLYSISAKVEEGCQFHTPDDIAAAVHHILNIVEDEATLCCQP